MLAQPVLEFSVLKYSPPDIATQVFSAFALRVAPWLRQCRLQHFADELAAYAVPLLWRSHALTEAADRAKFYQCRQ
jgi:hypothetical protein